MGALVFILPSFAWLIIQWLDWCRFIFGLCENIPSLLRLKVWMQKGGVQLFCQAWMWILMIGDSPQCIRDIPGPSLKFIIINATAVCVFKSKWCIKECSNWNRAFPKYNCGCNWIVTIVVLDYDDDHYDLQGVSQLRGKFLTAWNFVRILARQFFLGFWQFFFGRKFEYKFDSGAGSQMELMSCMS